MTTQNTQHETGFHYSNEAAENVEFGIGYALAAEAVPAVDAETKTDSVDIELVSELHYGKPEAEDYDFCKVQTPVTDYSKEGLVAVVKDNQESMVAVMDIKEQTTEAHRTLVEQGFAHFSSDEVLEPTFKAALEHLTQAAQKEASE
jgi:hypothetical protein|nr:MAG TPA: hypothetical protein [Caudoviricetes sp.]